MGQRQWTTAEANECSEDPLAQPTRRALVACIDASPGASVRALARALGVDDKTVLHHARVLEDAGIIVVGRRARRTACYRRGGEPACGADVSPELAAVLGALVSGRAARASDVARAVGVPRGTAWGQLATLRRLGLVDVRAGRWVVAGQDFS